MVVSLALSITGLVIAIMVALDLLLIRRAPALRWAFSYLSIAGFGRSRPICQALRAGWEVVRLRSTKPDARSRTGKWNAASSSLKMTVSCGKTYVPGPVETAMESEHLM